MDDETRSDRPSKTRLALVEQRTERHSSILEKVSSTLDRLVKFMTRAEDHREDIDTNHQIARRAEKKADQAYQYARSRWFVAVSIGGFVVAVMSVLGGVVAALQYFT